MIKKLVIGALAVIVLGAGAASAYNSTKTADVQTNEPAAAQIADTALAGQGQAYRAGNTNQNGFQVQDQSQGEGQNLAQAQMGEIAQSELANQLPLGEISEDEAAGLLFMLEEEKMAHDIYVYLYQTWGLQVFNNISQSEASHMASIQALTSKYGLADPTSSTLGVFTDGSIQALYDQLVARGSQSAVEALKVGGLVEETDILDLQERIAQTDNADIIQVYTNLLNGSGSHLRAFSSTLLREYGETYVPQLLSADEYALYMSGTNGGNGLGGNGNGGNGKGGRP